MPGQKFGPAWFPGLVAGGLGLCGAGLMAGGLRSGEPWVVTPPWLRSRRAVGGLVAVTGGLVFYILAADSLGFHLTAITLLALWTRILGASWRVCIPVALLVTLAIHLSFYKLLRIPLPWGVLEPLAF